ncbi:hypothetical protein QBC47DRAFT_385386 [Echria macrotheca]|uniref:Uncharacterized protein n=1 Tax=Echria macrotheca TaxID=438768 RepID=A0AAJ0F844_9PEZI|nr:hypothetical protein QBC47DRAFT_385386 [Echria macrotheca]
MTKMGNTARPAAQPGLIGLSCLFLLTTLFGFVFGDCWFEGGGIDSGKLPCYDAKRNTSPGLCCRHGDACFTDTLCGYEESGTWQYYKGSCNSRNWDKLGCPVLVCNDVEWEVLNTTVTVGRCPAPDDNRFYCDAGRDLLYCDNQPYTFTLKSDLDVYDWVGITSGSSVSTDETSTSTSTVTTTIRSGTITLTTDDMPTAASSSQSRDGALPPHATNTDSADANTPTQDAAGITTAPDAGQPSASDPSTTDSANSQNDGSVIPIAVGATFGSLIAVSGSLLAFFYLRKRRRETPVRAETPPAYYEPEMGCRVRGQPLSAGFWRWNGRGSDD